MCGGGGNKVEPLEPHSGSVTFNSTPAQPDSGKRREAMRQSGYRPQRQRATMLTGE
jgi:hypothetical protein